MRKAAPKMSEIAPPENLSGEAQPDQDKETQLNDTTAVAEPQVDTITQERASKDDKSEPPAPIYADGGVQTEAMPIDVSNGSLPNVESEVQEAASSTEPDSRPSVLIIGGLGMDLR